MTGGAAAVHVGALGLGSGLLALVRPVFHRLTEGSVLAVLSENPQVREDLPSWCRLERHEYLGLEVQGSGLDRHLIRRGPHPRWDKSIANPSSLPEVASRFTGLAPRGSWVERGLPSSPFTFLSSATTAPNEASKIYQQGLLAQWDVNRDIPWNEIPRHSPVMEGAVSQIFSFLAENELAALYVPAQYLPLIPPVYVETAQALALQLADEARHIEAFLRRARASFDNKAEEDSGCQTPLSTVSTGRSLLSLFGNHDFIESTFMLSVLGEGTFLDLLSYIEQHSPDRATAEIARRSKLDEARHVHFGLAHVRQALSTDPALFGRLESAVRRRAGDLAGQGVPAPVHDALIVLAAGSDDPRAISQGHLAFGELLIQMRENRIKRLLHAGFSPEQAARLADLHTPNFM